MARLQHMHVPFKLPKQRPRVTINRNVEACKKRVHIRTNNSVHPKVRIVCGSYCSCIPHDEFDTFKTFLHTKRHGVFKSSSTLLDLRRAYHTVSGRLCSRPVPEQLPISQYSIASSNHTTWIARESVPKNAQKFTWASAVANSTNVVLSI